MAITWAVEQRSEEWHRKRLGIPTASQFHRVITPKTGALSDQRHDYRNELVAERILQRRTERSKSTPWMQYGIAYEPEAVRDFLTRQFDLHGRRMELEKVGFITTNDGRIGCSPDRFVKRDPKGNAPREGVEIKCPAPWTQVGYLIGGLEAEFRPQVQGQMLVAELDLVHFYSFCPGLPAFHKVVERDVGYCDKLYTHLSTFLNELDQAEGVVRKLQAQESAMLAERAGLEVG